MLLLEKAGHTDLDRTLGAWRRFVSRNEIDSAVVRPHIERAWRRAAAAGCNPQLARVQRLSPAELLSLLDRERLLIDTARPFLDALSRAAGRDPHAATLADRDACVLDVAGDEQTVTRSGGATPGVLMSESLVGSNGVGTSLVEGGYVEVIGPEHYIEVFHGYTCQGMPLVGLSGEIIGSIAVCVERVETATRLRDVLFCATQGIECELMSQSLSDAVVAYSELSAPEVAERLRQDIVQRLAAARLNLDVAARRLGRGSDATHLLASAESLSRTFQRQAKVWRDLVCEQAAAPAPVVLGDMIDDLLDLLATEATTSKVALEWGCYEPMVAQVDRHAFSRRLLSKMLTAMQHAGEGGRVRVDVQPAGDRPASIVNLIAESPAGDTVASDQLLARQTAPPSIPREVPR